MEKTKRTLGVYVETMTTIQLRVLCDVKWRLAKHKRKLVNGNYGSNAKHRRQITKFIYSGVERCKTETSRHEKQSNH